MKWTLETYRDYVNGREKANYQHFATKREAAATADNWVIAPKMAAIVRRRADHAAVYFTWWDDQDNKQRGQDTR